MRGGEELILTVTDVSFGGWGVGRAGNLVVFVRDVLPGETIRARLRVPSRRFARADLLEIVTPAPTRIPSACPLADGPPRRQTGCPVSAFCPGCAYQHAAYETEIALKLQQLRTLLERHGGWTAPNIHPPLASPVTLGYRNKITLHAQRDGRQVRLGYFMEDNRTVLDVPCCPLAAAPIQEALQALRKKPGFMEGLRDGLAVTFRHTDHDGALWWRGQAGPRAVWLSETTSLGLLAVPRDSFFQVNPKVGAFLLETFRAGLAETRPERVADLFCGAGVFALAAAQAGVLRVSGADTDGEAIRAAILNRERMGCAPVDFITASAAAAVRRLRATWPDRQTAVLVDPPRDGLGRNMIRLLSAWHPEWLFYVSCAADTLARDLVWLREGGYEPLHTRLLDMFPRTAHFESFTLLRHSAPRPDRFVGLPGRLGNKDVAKRKESA